MPTAAGLYYFAHGTDQLNRPPVILIHGAGGTHLHWPPQIRRLNGQRIFAIDLPGHGKSQGISRQTISEYAADMLEFLQVMKLRSAVFIGHSMGSAIVLSLAIDHPEIILGLGLLGASARLRVKPDILENIANPQTFDAAVEMITEYSYGSQFDPRLKELAARRTAETRPPVLLGDFQACDAFNVLDDLPRIHAPTLILAGAEDRMTPPGQSQILSERISGAQFRLIPEAGHMVMVEQPQLTAAALEDFLNLIPYRPGQ